jgi:DMSO/TMAO reductase YedYZ heme-binding membrane subunit
LILLAASAGNAKTLWYLTRGTGVVALLLLTASVLLGVSSALRWRGQRWPRFAIGDLHRNLTLLSIVFVALHVATTVADGFAPISLKDAVLPFMSPYRPVWLGLGAVAFDLLLALVATSLLRGRVGPRLWRAVHWLAYVSWPIAILHSFGTGSDARFGWFESLGFACIALVSLAVLARVMAGGGQPMPRVAGAAASLLLPFGVFAWYTNGPGHTGWAARAGTPVTILSHTNPSRGHIFTAATVPPTSFVSRVAGGIQSASGPRERTITFVLGLHGGPGGAARIVLRGLPTQNGVVLTASGVSFVPATTHALYTGTVVRLLGAQVVADVSDSAGQRLLLTFDLSIGQGAERVSGTLTADTIGRDGE